MTIKDKEYINKAKVYYANLKSRNDDKNKGRISETYTLLNYVDLNKDKEIDLLSFLTDKISFNVKNYNVVVHKELSKNKINHSNIDYAYGKYDASVVLFDMYVKE